MLRVHRSNRLERLLDALAGLVAEPLPDPFLRETIVVQGKGMERWLSMELARRLGVWANSAFPFPRTLVNEATRAVLGAGSARDALAFEPEALQWRIAKLLPSLSEGPRFEPVRAYLAHDDPPAARRVRLAAEIASVFDRYVLYRPALVTAWENGDDGGVTDWQPLLWRALVAEAPPAHLAARLAAWRTRLHSADGALSGIPPRVSVFAVSTLAPLYLEAFAALAGRIDVHLFLLAPSREFLGGAMSARREARLRLGQLDLFGDAADPAPIDRGNPLVGSLGKLARDFQSLLEDHPYLEDDTDLFVDPAPDPAGASMLHVVQSDVLALRDRRADGGTAPPLPRPAADGSIQIHACHSPMREVEVLHDRLLDLFDADPTLEPRDVVVLAPSIDDYAPYIEAVFRADGRRIPIPFYVADRGPRMAEPVVDAFSRILDVLPGRFTAPEVFDTLSMDPVRRRFGIETADLDRLRAWIDTAAIRWGTDAAHRAEAGQHDIRENTWAFGLDRLALGFAMDEGLFAATTPATGVEGTAAELFGRLGDFCATLFSFRELAVVPRAVARWELDLSSLLDALIHADTATADQHRRIRQALESLAERSVAAGFEDDVPLEALRRELEREIEESSAAHGFLSGGVTFCAMIPMRSIPFRVVCVLGMNDGAFPRTARPPGFDRTARDPRPGDRSRRDDDRHLFLEALLSARDRFLVFHVGRSIQDNRPLPPSVVVSDLLDVLGDSFFLDTDAGAGPFDRRRGLFAALVTRHPLQAFSPETFRGNRDARLFSYSEADLAAARALLSAEVSPAPFLPGPLPVSDPPREVDLAELERFLEHPSRWFCQRRLNLYLGRDAGVLADAEPLEPDALERWTIGEALLSSLVEGRSPEDAFEAVRARGLLPPGEIGRAVWETVVPAASRIAEAVAARTIDPPLPPAPIDSEIAGVRITGILRGMYPSGQVHWTFSRLGGRRELRLWLRHLVLQLLAREDALRDLPRRTILIGRPPQEEDEVLASFRPLDEARGHLESLVGLWLEGSRQPPRFFADTSRACARALRAGRNHEAALRAARGVFGKRNNRNEPIGEQIDPYLVRLFGDEPLPNEAAAAFCDTAQRVYGPLLDHREPDR